MTDANLIARLEAATGPDRELDAAIAISAYGGTPADWPGCFWKGGEDYHPSNAPAFTASIDAALTLYIHKPDVVSTCPRKVCADALRERIEVLGQGSEGGAK